MSAAVNFTSGGGVTVPALQPARAPRTRARLDIRLLHIDPTAGSWRDRRVRDLPRLLRAGDLLVVNDAAVLPASLAARTERGETLEVRLAAERENGVWDAVLFGDGDWHARTEDRPAPPVARSGEKLSFEGGLVARVVGVSRLSPRLVRLHFALEAAAFWDALYRAGRPVQYSHSSRRLDLWDVQTCYAARPWAVEPPSAGLPLNWDALAGLRASGVGLAWITHAAGLSSKSDPTNYTSQPLPERFEVPAETAAAIERTRRAGGRVVAAGTTAVRALEGCAAEHGGRPVARVGVTDLRIGAGFVLRVVDGVLTGIHEPATSHYELLLAFLNRSLADRAHAHAARVGYLTHEFGDLCLVLGGRPRAMDGRIAAYDP